VKLKDDCWFHLHAMCIYIGSEIYLQREEAVADVMRKRSLMFGLERCTVMETTVMPQ